MVNITLEQGLVQHLSNSSKLASYPGHYLVALKKKGAGWRLHTCIAPGEPFKKPLLWPRKYFDIYIVPADKHLLYSFAQAYKTPYLAHSFDLRITVDYYVIEPYTLVQKLDLDPLSRIREEILLTIYQKIRSLDWNALRQEGDDLESILLHTAHEHEESSYKEIARFAASQGIKVRHLTIVRQPQADEYYSQGDPRNIIAYDIMAEAHRAVQQAADQICSFESHAAIIQALIHQAEIVHCIGVRRRSEVLISHVSPVAVKARSSFLIEIILHLSSLEPISQDGLKIEEAVAAIQIASGTELLVSLLPPQGFMVDDREVIIIWRPPRTRAQFLLTVDSNVVEGGYWAKARILTLGEQQIELCRFYIQIRVSSQATEPLSETRVRTVKRFPRSAFASYSRKDVHTVMQRVAALSSIGVEVFVDSLDIKEGIDWEALLESEVISKDTLLLFWSRHARDSKWVEREWRHALRVRGIAYITPNALEPVNVCPPPHELATLQFGGPSLLVAPAVTNAPTAQNSASCRLTSKDDLDSKNRKPTEGVAHKSLPPITRILTDLLECFRELNAPPIERQRLLSAALGLLCVKILGEEADELQEAIHLENLKGQIAKLIPLMTSNQIRTIRQVLELPSFRKQDGRGAQID